MKLQPYNSERFELDVGRGDILEESGNILVVGQLRGVRGAAETFQPEDFTDCPSEYVSSGRRICRYTGPALSWREVYSFHYSPGRRREPPRSDKDEIAHYWRLKSDLELFLTDLYLQDRFSGTCKLGLVPFSWRNSALVAHATAEALASFFNTLLHWPRKNQTLRVLIRSLDEPTEFVDVLRLDYYERWLRKRGDALSRGDVWYPLAGGVAQ